MYFNGKTYFNQDANMRVIADQRNPPPRKKGVKKKRVVKKKGGKIDMKKLKSLFGSDIIVKLLLSLVDKKSQGPNMKKESKKEKVRGMRKARGGGSFQTPGQVKAQRAKEDKERRIAQASVLKPGETQEDVLNRLIKEVAVGGDPASLAFLKANTIPPELRKLVGKMSVYGEAYFDENITPAKKKSLERTIVKEVIDGIGGDIRKDFIKSATEDEEIVEGFKEGVEALKKQGFTNPEEIIQQKDEIEKKLTKKREKTKSPEEAEEVEKALTGLEVVLYTGNTNVSNLEQNITEGDIEKIQSKVGAKKQSKTTRQNLLIKFAESENPDIELDGDNRNFFLKFVEDGLDSGATNAQIKSKMKTQLKALANNKQLKDFVGKTDKPDELPRTTRADAGIFQKGAIANKPNQFKIDLPDGTSQIFDGEIVMPRLGYLVKQIDLYERSAPSDIGTGKDLKRFKKELKEQQILFREQLSNINEGIDYKPEQGYSRQSISKKDNLDMTKLGEKLKKDGYFLPDDLPLDEGENVVGIGEEGFSILSKNGFIRYIDFDQKDFRKQRQQAEKRDAVEKKRLRQLGIKPSEQSTELQQLINDLPNAERYRLGLLSDSEIAALPPRLKADYPETKKIADKEAKEKEKTAISKPGGFGRKPLDKDKAEGTIFDRTTGRPITAEEQAADPFAAFDALGEGGQDLLSQEEAEQKQREQVRGIKFLEDMTPEEIAEITSGPVLTDAFGNPIDPLASIPRKPKTDEQEAERKKEKQDEQEELIERYKIDKSVLKDIKLAGRKKLTQQGLYTLTDEELESMSKKERKKYEAIIANRTAIQQSVYGEGGKEEADRLLLLRSQGKDLTPEEISKISYQDRKLQGLLTDKEVSEITDRTDKKDYLERKKRIEDQIEAVKVRERKEIIGDALIEGDAFDRLKEQADYYGQTRKELKEEQDFERLVDTAIGEQDEQQTTPLREFAFRGETPARPPRITETIVDKPPEDKPPPKTPPRPSRQGAGIDNSINEQANVLQSVDAAGPKKRGRGRPRKNPEDKKPRGRGRGRGRGGTIASAVASAMGVDLEKQKAEEERRKKQLEILEQQQKEQQREFLEQQGVNPDAKATPEEAEDARQILQSIFGGGGQRPTGSGSEEEDYSQVFNTGDLDEDDVYGEQEHLLEGDF